MTGDNENRTLFEAIEFATLAHAGQFRKSSNLPYIVHPISVMQRLLEAGTDSEIAAAGVLHDTIEDTKATIDQIETKFGQRIARMVSDNSEPPRDSYSWEERKRHTLENLQSAPVDSLLVTAADKLDNLCALRSELAMHGDVVWRRFRRPKEKQAWYFGSVRELLEKKLTTDPGFRFTQEIGTEVHDIFGT